MTDSLIDSIQRSADKLEQMRAAIATVLVGQTALVEQVLVCLLAEGHVLLEGVPGLGKTLLVRTLSKTLNIGFSRIQFTPDLMPSDITGHALYNMGTQQFEIRKGPVFTNLLLADEINRAPAKTQSALLEVMQERQVTIEGKSFMVDQPFMVLATQNPVEQDGTYPLPEAELDRFLMKVLMDYPSELEEQQLASLFALPREQAELSLNNIPAVLTASELRDMQQLSRQLPVSEAVVHYAVRLVRATRSWPMLARGAGPRATLALIACGKAQALLAGNSFVLPDHIKQVALPVLRHRVTPTAEMVIEGSPIDRLLTDLLSQVEAPRYS